MASSFNPSSRPAAALSADGRPRLADAAIDASTRIPVLLLVASAAAWLVAGSLLSVIASVKLHAPAFLGNCEFLTYGRVRAVETTAFIYGWGFNVAFAVSLWLLARLSRGVLLQPALLLVAVLFWNLGVSIGAVAIFLGDGTSLEMLDMPGYVAPILFFAYVFIGIWTVLTYQAGKSEHVYISQWYVLAALFWFPWIFSLAEIMLFIDPVRGTVQSLIHTWYSQGLFYLWFAPIGLGAIYYFLPKLLTRPVSNYYLSVYGFWMLAIFGGWAGMSRLVGGPVPAWVVSAGIAASLMLVVTLVVVTVNIIPTLRGAHSSEGSSGAFKFIAFGAIAFLVALLANIVLSLRGVAEITQFTFVLTAQTQLSLYGFFSMVAFGALYYLLPRVLGTEWSSSGLVSVHFWLSALGVVLGVVALTLGGLKQGHALNALTSPEESPIPLVALARQLIPYLSTQTLAATILLLGHLVFALNLARTVYASCVSSVRPSTSVGYRNPKEAVIR